MTVDEKQKLLAELAAGRDALTEALNGVTDETAARNPEAGRWSIINCVEHLAQAEQYLFSQILASYPAGAPAVNPKREALIMERGADRSRPLPAPQMAIPKSRFSSLADARDAFLSTREQTVRFVENCNDDLRTMLAVHPILGTVNCYEMLLMIAVHPRRHAKQIAEIHQSLVQ